MGFTELIFVTCSASDVTCSANRIYPWYSKHLPKFLFDALTGAWIAQGEQSSRRMQPNVIDPQLSGIADERRRREAWREAIAPVFETEMDPTVPVPRDIGFRCYNLGSMLYGTIRASAQTIERTPSQIATQGIDHVILRFYGSGTSGIDTPDGPADIAPGSFVLFDLSQRARSVSTGMTGINLGIPRRLFDRRVGEVSALHRGRFGADGSPLFRLLSDHVRNVGACLDRSGVAQRSLLSSATVALCNASFTPTGDSAHNRPAVALLEIRQFVDDNLAHAELGVDALCARFGLSRRAVFRLFEAEGGVMTYVRNRRLARAMRMLSGIVGEAPTRVSGVAYAVGYASPKMFSKAFHARYGVNPRDVDATYRERSDRETGDRLLAWIQEL